MALAIRVAQKRPRVFFLFTLICVQATASPQPLNGLGLLDELLVARQARRQSIVHNTRRKTFIVRVRSQQGARDCEGLSHNYISSFPAGVHAPGFRLSAKVNKVEGCAWLDAHQSPDRSHSQRIFQIDAKVLSLFLIGSQEGGRRGAFCGIEELRAVSGTSL